jgi:hypothetical protein
MIKSEKHKLRKVFMKKIMFILLAMLLVTGLVLTGCGTSGGSSSGKSAGGSSDNSVALSFPFRHFLGMNGASNWNATNTNQAPLSSILEHTYTFVDGRKTVDYLDYFFLEKREAGRAPLRIKAITIIADNEKIPLNLRNVETETSVPDYPIAPLEYDRDTLVVNYPVVLGARLAIIIPQNRKATIAAARTVSVKIELD